MYQSKSFDIFQIQINYIKNSKSIKKTSVLVALRTLSKTAGLMNLRCSSVSQHPTDDVPILLVPDVVTHRPPSALVKHLHASLMGTRPVHQTHQSLLDCRTTCTQTDVVKICTCFSAAPDMNPNCRLSMLFIPVILYWKTFCVCCLWAHRIFYLLGLWVYSSSYLNRYKMLR